MAKDFFADIHPPSPPAPRAPTPVPTTAPQEPKPAATPTPDRSIRNIPVTRRVPINASPPRVGSGEIRSEGGPQAILGGYVESPPRGSRFLIWSVAGVALVVLVGAALYFFFGDTTVVVTPRTHQITFDDSTQFSAYPTESASAGAITYTTESTTLEDSAVVPATGTEQAQDRATGTITVYNDYSTSPVRLIKNTRFQSPGGMIFRIPSSVDVPGRKGSTAGQVTVTVIADQAGEAYNIAPADKFTLPGLKSSPDMYTGVWARSTETFSGGFSGTKPAVSKGALDAARNEIRGRLLEKARSAVALKNTSEALTFFDLAVVSYESLPTTPDASGSARVNEKAVVTYPVFSLPAFARSVASAVSAEPSDSPVTLKSGGSFSAKIAGDRKVIGKDPLTFTLNGAAVLVWGVDSTALAEALAGKDQAAFETIIGSFHGVDKAEASISPFWKKSFPADAGDIEVTVEEPATP